MSEMCRVFFHELGHFIAHELNSHLYGGHKTKSILLNPYPPLPELYVGEAKIEVENDTYIPSKEELASYLASCTYGCLFQAYFTGEGLKQAQNRNGDDDMRKWYGALMVHKLQDSNADIHGIDLEYMDHLIEEDILKDFMALVPEHYLLEQGQGVFVVDLKKLRADIKDIVADHQKSYAELVNKYSRVLTEPKPE